MAEWRNRIVGEGAEAPDQLLAHPDNWRIHPKGQQDALGELLDRVGWVQRVLVNRRTSEAWGAGERHVHTLVDGHLRVMLALRRDEPSIPVQYVDLTPEEERLVLVSLDPVAQLAVADAKQLEGLLATLQATTPALDELFAGLAQTAGLAPVRPQVFDATSVADAALGTDDSAFVLYLSFPDRAGAERALTLLTAGARTTLPDHARLGALDGQEVLAVLDGREAAA